MLRRFFTNRVARMVAEGPLNDIMKHPQLDQDVAKQAGAVAQNVKEKIASDILNQGQFRRSSLSLSPSDLWRSS